MGLLDGKVALITGAGRGIGRAEALLFAAEGARLVVNDLGTDPAGRGADPTVAESTADAVRAAGGEATPSTVDVSEPDGAQAAGGLGGGPFGRLDIVVNSAGATIELPLLQLETGLWQRLLAVQLTATLLCTQAAARAMIRQGEGGRIVNTTGLPGLQGTSSQAAGAAALAGVYGLTRASAIELQKHRITVNAIAPTAKTRLTEGLLQMQGLDELTAEHVAPAALFFASSLCRDRTGETLAVAGARIARLRLAQGQGRFKEGPTPWSAAEIDEHWSSLGKP